MHIIELFIKCFCKTMCINSMHMCVFGIKLISRWTNFGCTQLRTVELNDPFWCGKNADEIKFLHFSFKQNGVKFVYLNNIILIKCGKCCFPVLNYFFIQEFYIVPYLDSHRRIEKVWAESNIIQTFYCISLQKPPY